MKLSHGLGFFGMGAVMLALPQVLPTLCPRNGFDGSSGRELWLYVMGCLHSGLGLSALVRTSIAAALEVFQSWPDTLADLWDHIPSRTASDQAELEGAAFCTAEVVEVDFSAKPAWEQSRAA